MTTAEYSAMYPTGPEGLARDRITVAAARPIGEHSKPMDLIAGLQRHDVPGDDPGAAVAWLVARGCPAAEARALVADVTATRPAYLGLFASRRPDALGDYAIPDDERPPGAHLRTYRPDPEGPIPAGPETVDLGSVRAGDAGFDARAAGIPVRLALEPGRRYRIAHARGITEGTPEFLCRALVDDGYRVVAAETANGREVRATPDGFEVQPRGDNTWVTAGTLAEALAAAEGRRP